jgi:hypothetical protein
VDTSYSVQWDECFLKGQETEEKPIISKLMKDNYVTEVVNYGQYPTKCYRVKADL